MRTLEAFAICYTRTRTKTRRLGAKIHGAENPQALDDTIQTEQPSNADDATA
jgi:hypothetical protein